MLCTRELAERARLAAYNLLVEMGHTSMRWGQSLHGSEGGSSLMDFFELVLAGLAGSPHMVACTILGLTKLLYEFRGEFYSN